MAVPVQEATKRRTFKKFTYQGVDLDDLKTMPLCDLKELFPSSFRRHVNRGFSEEEHMLIKQAERGESGIRTQCRNMMILPIMVGNIIGVHNGCNYVEIDVKPEMIGRRFKDLVPTKTSKAHGKPGVGATSSSKFVPLNFIFHSFMLFFIFIRNTSFKAAIRIDRLGACHEDVMLADKSDVFSRTHDEATMNRKTCAKDEKVALADYNTGACTDLEDFMADDTECVMKAGKIEHTYPSSIDLSIFLFKNFSAHQKRTFLRTYARIYSAIAPRLSVLDRVVRRTSNDKKEQLAHYMTVHVLRYGNVKRRMRYAFRCVYGCNEVVSMVLSVIGFVVNLWCGWGVLREKNREETKSDTGANTGRNAATGREHTSMIIDKDVQINTNGTGTVVQEYAVPVIVSEHVMKSKQRGMNINLVVEGEERTEMMLLMAKTKVKDENENASGATLMSKTKAKDENENASGATLMAKTKVKDENENASGATLMAKTKVKDENENASGAKEHAHSNHANNRVMTGNTETAHETEQAPFIRSYLTLIKVQCTINALTFMSSILLHINDTPLTKRLDYFFVLLSILHACHTFVVKLSYLYGTPRPSIFVSLTLFSLITAKHLFSFNPTLLKYTCALFISFFCAGMLFEYFKVRTPFIAVFVCLTILCVVVEGLDVRPIVFLVDSHAVWHFLVIGQMVLYYRYLKIDLKRILVRAGRANES